MLNEKCPPRQIGGGGQLEGPQKRTRAPPMKRRS